MARRYPTGSTPHSGRAARRRGTLAVCVLCLAGAAAGPGAAAARATRGGAVQLHSGQLTLRFSAKAFAALTRSSAGYFADTRSVTPVAPAMNPAAGDFTFPVASGRVNASALTGRAVSRGGIEFTDVDYREGKTFEFQLRALTLNLSASPAELVATFVGATTDSGIAIATVDSNRAHHVAHHGSVSISGLTLQLTNAGQEAFNLQTSGFRFGETVGTLSLAGRD